MTSINPTGNAKEIDPVADHPIVKRLVADVAALQSRQADMEIRQIDLEQSIVLIRGLVERMHDRQEHLLGQTNFIVEWIKASGDTGAQEP